MYEDTNQQLTSGFHGFHGFQKHIVFKRKYFVRKYMPLLNE